MAGFRRQPPPLPERPVFDRPTPTVPFKAVLPVEASAALCAVPDVHPTLDTVPTMDSGIRRKSTLACSPLELYEPPELDQVDELSELQTKPAVMALPAGCTSDEGASAAAGDTHSLNPLARSVPPVATAPRRMLMASAALLVLGLAGALLWPQFPTADDVTSLPEQPPRPRSFHEATETLPRRVAAPAPEVTSLSRPGTLPLVTTVALAPVGAVVTLSTRIPEEQTAAVPLEEEAAAPATSSAEPDVESADIELSDLESPVPAAHSDPPVQPSATQAAPALLPQPRGRNAGAGPGAATPTQLASRLGHALLAIDPNAGRYRVTLPHGVARAQENHRAVVRMCVTPQGRVSSVTILRSAGDVVDARIVNVLSRWRYRPWRQNGQAEPFCYAFQYELG